MSRRTIIAAIFVLAVVAVVLASQLIRSQPPVEVTVAVSPLAEDWVREAVAAFNATEPIVNTTRPIRVQVVAINDMDVWGDRTWTPDDHPTAWIAASAASVAYAEDNGVPLETVQPSLARTPLVWGGYSSRVNVLTEEGAIPLDWDVIAAAGDTASWSELGGEDSWQFVKFGFDQPGRKMGGLAALFTAAADFTDNPNLTGGAVVTPAFQDWLLPVVAGIPNLATLGNDPAGAMARGPSTVELALFPESLWLNNLSGMLNNENVVLNYPEYQFVLDFPLVRWDDNRVTSVERAAIEALGDWLLESRQQRSAQTFGLRPADGDLNIEGALFVAAQPSGIQLQPDYGQAVQPPSRSQVQVLLQWFDNNSN